MIPWDRESYEEREDDDESSSERAECEDIARDMVKSLIISICIRFCHLTHCDRIEPEISDGSKYREIVVYLRVESKSFDTQVLSQETYEKYRYKGGAYFSEDLCSGI